VCKVEREREVCKRKERGENELRFSENEGGGSLFIGQIYLFSKEDLMAMINTSSLTSSPSQIFL